MLSLRIAGDDRRYSRDLSAWLLRTGKSSQSLSAVSSTSCWSASTSGIEFKLLNRRIRKIHRFHCRAGVYSEKRWTYQMPWLTLHTRAHVHVHEHKSSVVPKCGVRRGTSTRGDNDVTLHHIHRMLSQCHCILPIPGIRTSTAATEH